MVFFTIATVPAFACPQYCACDSKGNIVYNYNTNTSYNTSSNASAASASTASVSGSGNNDNVNNVKGGTATIAPGAVTNNVSAAGGQGGKAVATIAPGAVQNTVTGGTASQTQSQSQNNTGNDIGTSSADTSINTPKQPVSTAYSASLTSGLDTCLGSASGGIQTGPVGLTFGSTKVDKNCILIKQTKLLREQGFDKGACVRMTLGNEGELIREAMKEAGESCDDIILATVTPVTQKDLDKVQTDVNQKLDNVIRVVTGK